jgi:hypothetical protein
MATVLGCVLPNSSVLFRTFLWAIGLNANDIHKEIFPVHGGNCLSYKAVHNWFEKRGKYFVVVKEFERGYGSG